MPSDRKSIEPPRRPGKKTAEAERKERLAAALRANLRRRKAQSRARAERLPEAERGGGHDPEES